MIASPERRAALKAAFESFDENGDGVISPSELDKALQACGSLLFEDEIAMVMGQFQGQGIGFDAFCKLAEERPETDSYAADQIRKAISRAFPERRHSDSSAVPTGGATESGPGEHAADGFSAFFKFFHEAAAAFNAFDEDGDGTITQAEVAGVLRSLGHEPSDASLAAVIEALSLIHI